MKRGRSILAVMLAIGMAGCLVACGGSKKTSGETPVETSTAANSSVAETPSGEKITVNVCEPSQSLISLDLYKYSQHTAWQYGEMVYDALLQASYDGKFESNICTSYELAEDGLSAVLHLAENVVFHDGTPCNADDVVATMNYLAENKETLGMITSVWTNLVSAEKVDDYTVKVNMSEKSHTFEIALGYTFILSDEDLEKYGDQMWAQGVVNGTGPWKYDEWIDGQYVKFTRNDDFWKGRNTNVDEVYIWYISEANTQVSSLISGEVDYVSNVNFDLLSMLQGQPELTVEEYVADSMQYMQFKMGSGDAFEDINMRKAAMHAINFEGLLSLYGGGRVMNCSATIGNDGYREDLTAYEYNPELAKKYLAESNYDGRELSIYSWTSESSAVTAIASDLQSAGFKININLCDSAAFSSIRSKGEYDMFWGAVATWDGDLMTQYITPRILNDCHKNGYVDEHINQLIATADAENDREKRRELLEEVVGILYENYGPICGSAQKGGYRVTRNGLSGYNATAGGPTFFRNVSVDEAVWKK